MSDLDALLSEINLVDSELRANFTVDGIDYWCSKGKGQIRRKRNAMGLAAAMQANPDGIMGSAFDDRIVEITEGLAKGSKTIGGAEFFDYCDELPEVTDSGEEFQVTHMTKLVMACVLAHMGKKLLGSALTSGQSEDQSDEKPKPTDSGSNSKMRLQKRSQS